VTLNPNQGGEMWDGDKRREIGGVRDLKGPDQGRQPLRAKPQRLPLNADGLNWKKNIVISVALILNFC